MVLAESKSVLRQLADGRGRRRVFIQNASQNVDSCQRGGIQVDACRDTMPKTNGSNISLVSVRAVT
jgi:hypothetical protein